MRLRLKIGIVALGALALVGCALSDELATDDSRADGSALVAAVGCDWVKGEYNAMAVAGHDTAVLHVSNVANVDVGSLAGGRRVSVSEAANAVEQCVGGASSMQVMPETVGIELDGVSTTVTEPTTVAALEMSVVEINQLRERNASLASENAELSRANANALLERNQARGEVKRLSQELDHFAMMVGVPATASDASSRSEVSVKTSSEIERLQGDIASLTRERDDATAEMYEYIRMLEACRASE